MTPEKNWPATHENEKDFSRILSWANSKKNYSFLKSDFQKLQTLSQYKRIMLAS